MTKNENERSVKLVFFFLTIYTLFPLRTQNFARKFFYVDIFELAYYFGLYAEELHGKGKKYSLNLWLLSSNLGRVPMKCQ